jgi:hypothetical protein
VTRQNRASSANSSQVARSEKQKKGKDLRGESKMSESLISVYETALRGSLEVFYLAHPAGQWVPSGENLGHHPSLMNAAKDAAP